MTAETEPNSARNCPSERFKKYIRPDQPPRARTSEPKITSSIGMEVETPTYRPPFRSASCSSDFAYWSNDAV